MNFKNLSWSRIETSWNQLRKRQRDDELSRAIFLQRLRDKQPWTDRGRYTSQAVYDELSEYSFDDIVRYRLHEGIAEVRNTLLALDTFGVATFKRYGRIVLLRVHNRVTDKATRTRALHEINRATRKLKWRKNALSQTVITSVLDKLAPRKNRTNTIEMVRKLKEANAQLKKRVRELEAENTLLKNTHQVVKTSRAKKMTKAAHRKLKAV